MKCNEARAVRWPEVWKFYYRSLTLLHFSTGGANDAQNVSVDTARGKDNDHQNLLKKISPVGDWRSTSLEWPWRWPWFRPYGIPSCITHRPLPTYQISLRSEEKFIWKSPQRFWSSSESRDTKTRTNMKNPARTNLDIFCALV